MNIGRMPHAMPCLFHYYGTDSLRYVFFQIRMMGPGLSCLEALPPLFKNDRHHLHEPMPNLNLHHSMLSNIYHVITNAKYYTVPDRAPSVSSSKFSTSTTGRFATRPLKPVTSDAAAVDVGAARRVTLTYRGSRSPSGPVSHGGR